MPTATLEEYLEAIYKLSRSGPARPSAVAEAMSVSAPTVTATLRRLSERGLVTRPSGGVELTEEGVRQALSILRRHRLAERFLVDVLGLPWDDVHEDACLLEHALSPRVQDALAEYLDDPEACPHGHPIPGSDLSVAESSGRPLSEARAGSTVRVVSVDERDDDIVGHVGGLGLFPGTEVRVLEADPFGGALIVEVAGERVMVGGEVAVRISVAAAEEAPSDG